MLLRQKINRVVALRLLSLVLLGVLFAGLSACSSDHGLGVKEDVTPENAVKGNFFNNGNIIDRNPTFDKGNFINQSKQGEGQDYKYGPNAEDTNPITEKERYSKIVNEEESFDYVDMADLEKNNFKISMNVENMNIRDFADMVSTITGVNILVSDEVNGVVSAKLKDVYWTSMLDSILSTKKLAKHVDTKSNIIRIHDQNTVVQLEDFEEKRKENVQKSLQLKKASQPLYTEIFKLFYTKPAQIKTQLEGVLSSKTAATDSGMRNINPEVTIDERKNLIIVKARKEDMDIIAKLIKELDTRTQQIFIEAFVVEVDDGFEQAFGAKFGGNYAKPGSSGVQQVAGLQGTVGGSSVLGGTTNTNTASDLSLPNPLGGIGVLTGIGSSADLKVELTAMQTDGLSKIISNPRIFTLDNQEATIFQGEDIPYVNTSSQLGTQTEFKEAGLKLSVTPQIIGDGNLQLNIQVNKDSADTTQANPPISKSEIKTNLVTKDGQIVVMGGIYTETKTQENDQIPGVGDIPVIGHLFKRNDDKNERKELVIFISPKIL